MKYFIKKGERFGRLVAISEPYTRDRARRVKCKCDCGNVCERTVYALKTGLGHGSYSCGCSRNPYIPRAEKNRPHFTAEKYPPEVLAAHKLFDTPRRAGIQDAGLRYLDEHAQPRRMYTLDEIGFACQCSRERIRQITALALKHARKILYHRDREIREEMMTLAE